MQRCDTNGAQWAVGKTNTEHNVNEARKRAAAYMVRVLRPGQVTTTRVQRGALEPGSGRHRPHHRSALWLMLLISSVALAYSLHFST